MTRTTIRAGMLREPLLFAAALWLSLTMALLSALLPMGLPSSQTIGSAFNPATTAVALRTSSDEQVSVAAAIREDDRDVAAAVLPAPIELLRPFADWAPVVHAPGPRQMVGAAPHGLPPARAPPID